MKRPVAGSCLPELAAEVNRRLLACHAVTG
jgi:hypothetical protein